MAVAREALIRLGNPDLDRDELGCYLLGATAPDIRVLTGQRREETHFVDLEADHGENGTASLFAAYPHVLHLQGRSRAFVSGYLTHLNVDELWIREIYRPFFGRDSALESSLEANFMDRVLQYHIDRGERLDGDQPQQFYEHILQAEPGEAVQFLDVPTLQKWREVVARIVSTDPTWDNFRTFIFRRFGGMDALQEEQLRAFCEAIPEVLERTLQHVTPERIALFKEDAVSRSVAAVRNYN